MVRFRRLYSKVDILIFSFSVKMSVRKKVLNVNLNSNLNWKQKNLKKLNCNWVWKTQKVGILKPFSFWNGHSKLSKLYSKLIYKFLKAVDDLFCLSEKHLKENRWLFQNTHSNYYSDSNFPRKRLGTFISRNTLLKT